MAPRRVLADGDNRTILPHQLGDFVICFFLAVFGQDSWVSLVFDRVLHAAMLPSASFRVKGHRLGGCRI